MSAARSGSVSRDGDRWRVRVRDASGKQLTLCRTSDEDEAYSMLEAFKLELVGTDHDPERGRHLTLGAFAEDWFTAREATHRDVRNDRSRFRTHVAGTALAGVRLSALERKHVRQFLRDLAQKPSPKTGEPLAEQTQRNVLNLVRACLDAAVERELLDANPAKDAAIVGRRARTDDTTTFLTAPEIDQLFALRSLTDEQRAVFAIAIYGGLRQGEIAALCWADVHLDDARPRLVVRASWDTPTKTGRVRETPLLRPAVQALRAWQRVAPRSPRGFVFPSSTGGLRSRGYSWRFARTCTRAGITRHVRFHDLRHTAGSHLIMGTWNERGHLTGRPLTQVDVAEWLGHTQLATTERYMHLAPDALHSRVVATAPKSAPGPAKARAAAPTAPLHTEPPQPKSIEARLRPLRPDLASCDGNENAVTSCDYGVFLEPPIRLERTTCGLRNRCSTD